MEITPFLNPHKADGDLIWQFAFLGKDDTCKIKFKELSELAEEENWTSMSSRKELDILYSYIYHTFARAAQEDLVYIKDDKSFAAFNTGLLTKNGEDIICLFNEFTSSNEYHWHLHGFRKESHWDVMSNFSSTPPVVSYFSDPSKIYFDPTKDMVKNLDHILEDNFERFPKNLREKGPTHINALLTYALDLTLKRCKRNYRIAVPQYYKEKITYLLPANLDGYLMSVAVEEVNSRYRVNTIFTVEMAYKNARLLMKPEVDWLTTATKKEAES